MENRAVLADEITFKLASTALAVTDADGLVVAVNAELERRFGALAGQTLFSTFVIDGERSAASTAFRAAFESGTSVELRGLCAIGGVTRAVAWSCAFAGEEVLVTLADVAASSAELELDALFRAIGDIYFRLDGEGRIVAFRSAREGELHVPPDQFVGRRAQDLVPPDTAPTIAAAVERVISERAPVQIEYALPTPSGDDRFEAYLVPCGAIEVSVLIRNTTARHRTEAALRATEERLLATQKLDAIGQLAGGVAHDFNNLLGVVLGRLGFLQRAEGLSEIDRDHVKEAFEAATHGAALTRQLLAFGRRRPMRPTTFDLNIVLSNMQAMLGRMLGSKITTTFTLANEPCTVVSDPVQIEQVVINLAVNARHAMQPDGGKLHVSTSVVTIDEASLKGNERKAGTFVKLAVEDEGCGMDADVLEHLFEPFFTTKSQESGTGLGLATVYGIVKQSGGHVDVKSVVGRGSTFELFFPFAVED